MHNEAKRGSEYDIDNTISILLLTEIKSSSNIN